VLERGGEVDEVGNSERQVQLHVPERMPSAFVADALDERIPAGTAERKDLFERRVALDLDDVVAVAPPEPVPAVREREDAEAAQRQLTFA
jgi:hypothetical protein